MKALYIVNALILLNFSFQASAQVRVSCIGDSITWGVCGTTPYPTLLQQYLGDGFVVKNFGNSGKTMLVNGQCGPPASGNCSYIGTDSWPAALASNPDIVTIMLGTNDAKQFNWIGVQEQGDSYIDDYLHMIRTLQALPSHPKIFLMTLVPLYAPYPYEMNATVINEIISPVPQGLVATIAERTGVSLIDLHRVFVDGGFDASITCDGCHPTDDGYRVIASVLTPILRQAARPAAHSPSPSDALRHLG